jgi:hypothetical protein
MLRQYEIQAPLFNLVKALEKVGCQVAILSVRGIDPRRTAGVMPFLGTMDCAKGAQRIWKHIRTVGR